MSGPLDQALDRLGREHRAGRPVVLLFDYDGTLAPFVDRPEDARAPDATLHLLAQLARVERLAVGIVSGRMLDDVRRMVGLDGLYYAGTNGLEMDLRGAKYAHPRAAASRARIDKAIAALQPLLNDHAGARIEDKRFGLTVHYRHLDESRHDDFHAQAWDRLSAQPGLRVLRGPLAIEVIPELGCNKGTALRTIVESVGGAPIPFYAGDEANDADALQAAAELHGIGVGVGPRAPDVAQHRLADPQALQDVLVDLSRRLV